MNWLEDERFTSKIEDIDGHWIWQGGRGGRGKHAYGRFSFRVNGVAIHKLAHRLSYESKHGPIPKGLVLDHFLITKGCQTLCCHPDHTEPVTQRVNVQRAAARKTHCPKGHPYDERNTKEKPTKYGGINRVCKACARDYANRKYEADRD